MTLKVTMAKKASIPQRMGAVKSAPQKKLLSVGWMNRCSCAQEKDTRTHLGSRRGISATALGGGGRVPRSSRISSGSVQPRPRHSTTSARRAAALRRS